ncbi:MAG: hypothetical protein PUG10_02625 [Lachnospiraceae bacterium]|nr:hypothetical protein [Lachnospiraceae bacterium]
MSNQTIALIMLGTIVFLFVVLFVLTIVLIVKSSKKSDEIDESEVKVKKSSEDKDEIKKNTTKGKTPSKQGSDKNKMSPTKTEAKASKRSTNNVKKSGSRDEIDKNKALKKATDKKNIAATTKENSKKDNNKKEQTVDDSVLSGDTKEIDTKKVKNSSIENKLAKRQAAADKNIEPTLAKKTKISDETTEEKQEVIENTAIIETQDTPIITETPVIEEAPLNAADAAITDKESDNKQHISVDKQKINIKSNDEELEDDEEMDEDTDKLIGKTKAEQSSVKSTSADNKDVISSEKTVPRIVNRNNLSFEKERLTTSIPGYNIKETLGFRHNEEDKQESATTNVADSNSVASDAKNSITNEASNEAVNTIDKNDTSNTIDSAFANNSSDEDTTNDVIAQSEAYEDSAFSSKAYEYDDDESDEDEYMMEEIQEEAFAVQDIAAQDNNAAYQDVNMMQMGAVTDNASDIQADKIVQTPKKVEKQSENTVASNEQFYWYNKDDVLSRPKYKTPEMYYHNFDKASDVIEDLLVEMYDSALVRTEEIRYIAYGIVPQSYSLKEIMSGKSKMASMNKLKQPTREDLELIFVKWCEYVDKLFDVVEIHADEATINEIRRVLCEFGRSDVDILLEGM